MTIKSGPDPSDAIIAAIVALRQAIEAFNDAVRRLNDVEAQC